nr:type I restriction-modification system subunit M N-terminal domain-containing protein [Persicimonas caeni]
MDNFQEKVSFIWSVADLLRGDYKQSQYGRVILPFTVLRRLDCVLEATKDAVLEANDKYADSPEAVRHKMLEKAAEHSFYNTSAMDFGKLLGDPNHTSRRT